MLSKLLKTRNTNALVKMGEIISKSKVDPNIVTVSAVIFAAFSAYYVMQNNYILAIAFMFFAGIVDMVDGAVARAQKNVTYFGNYLDAMTDKYVEIILYAGFALSGYAVPAFFAITGSLIISYAKPRLAIVIPADNHDWPAIGERADRYVILLAGMILSTIKPVLYGYGTIAATLWAVAIVTNLGAIQRMLYARGLIKEHASKKP